MLENGRGNSVFHTPESGWLFFGPKQAKGPDMKQVGQILLSTTAYHLCKQSNVNIQDIAKRQVELTTQAIKGSCIIRTDCFAFAVPLSYLEYLIKFMSPKSNYLCRKDIAEH